MPEVNSDGTVTIPGGTTIQSIGTIPAGMDIRVHKDSVKDVDIADTVTLPAGASVTIGDTETYLPGGGTAAAGAVTPANDTVKVCVTDDACNFVNGSGDIVLTMEGSDSVIFDRKTGAIQLAEASEGTVKDGAIHFPGGGTVSADGQWHLPGGSAYVQHRVVVETTQGVKVYDSETDYHYIPDGDGYTIELVTKNGVDQIVATTTGGSGDCYTGLVTIYDDETDETVAGYLLEGGALRIDRGEFFGDLGNSPYLQLEEDAAWLYTGDTSLWGNAMKITPKDNVSVDSGTGQVTVAAGSTVEYYRSSGETSRDITVEIQRDVALEIITIQRDLGNSGQLQSMTELGYVLGDDGVMYVREENGSGVMTVQDAGDEDVLTAAPPKDEEGVVYTIGSDGNVSLPVGSTVTEDGKTTVVNEDYVVTPDGTLKELTSSSGSSGASGYSNTITEPEHGTVTVRPRTPSRGDTVTVTVEPDDGYVFDSLTVTDRNGDPVDLTDNGDGTYTFTQPAGRVTIAATFVLDLPFRDVETDDWFFDAVAWAVENGVTNGTGATTFGPDASCTRAQMVTFLWRAAGSPEPGNAVNPFDDVSAGAYYHDAVLWAVEQGITNGTGATTFSPDATVTRAQTVTFLWRYDGAAAASDSGFADVPADAYYAGAVAWAVSEGVTNGTSAATFSPDADCIRAQIVTFLYRYMV